jgi:hypothetical protein
VIENLQKDEDKTSKICLKTLLGLMLEMFNFLHSKEANCKENRYKFADKIAAKIYKLKRQNGDILG